MPTPPRCRAGWWSLVPAFLSFLLSRGGSSGGAVRRLNSACAVRPRWVCVRCGGDGSACLGAVSRVPAPAAAWPDAAPWVVVRPRFVGARSLGRGRALRAHPRRALAVPDRGERGCGTALSARLYHDAPEVKPQGLDIWLAS